jgi:hypothetical protein
MMFFARTTISFISSTAWMDWRFWKAKYRQFKVPGSTFKVPGSKTVFSDLS